jgi:hypothetical protein
MSTLIADLVNIERIVGKSDPIAIRRMVVEVQESVLHLQQQLVDALEDNGRLREQQAHLHAVLGGPPSLRPVRV